MVYKAVRTYLLGRKMDSWIVPNKWILIKGIIANLYAKRNRKILKNTELNDSNKDSEDNE